MAHLAGTMEKQKHGVETCSEKQKKKNACRPFRVYTVYWNKQGFTVPAIDSKEKQVFLYIKQCRGWARPVTAHFWTKHGKYIVNALMLLH